jgi:hypothetical protein
MFVEAEIITDSNTSKGLPEAAVVEADNRKFILVEKGKSGVARFFERKEVQTGIRENGIVQILNQEDFSTVNTVLIVGAFNLITEE